MVKRLGDQEISVRLSSIELKGMWTAASISVLACIIFVIEYISPGTVFPRLEKREHSFWILFVVFFLFWFEFLRVGSREEWYRAKFTINAQGIWKTYPSGREEIVRWEEIASVNRWRDTIKTSDGRKLVLGYFGLVGFGRTTMRAIYEIAGHDSLFVRQYTGQERAVK